MTMHHRPSPAHTLRAFLAYCEGGEIPSNPFTLLPYEEAIAMEIPFSETYTFEGYQWAVFVTGDITPWELLALEKAGIVDAQ